MSEEVKKVGHSDWLYCKGIKDLLLTLKQAQVTVQIHTAGFDSGPGWTIEIVKDDLAKLIKGSSTIWVVISKIEVVQLA